MKSLEIHTNKVSIEIITRDNNISELELMKEASRQLQREVLKRESITNGNIPGNVHSNVLPIDPKTNG